MDAEKFGNLLRFANHQPKNESNAESKYCLYERVIRVQFWTKRKIDCEQEIFIDYGKSFFK